MNFKLEPLPEDADAGLAVIHGEVHQVVTAFESKAATIQADQRRTRIQRDIDLDFSRRDTLAELKQGERSLKIDCEHFANRRRELRVYPATGDRLLRLQEVRAALRSMTTKQREAALQEAVEQRDELLLNAVRDGVFYLCGLNEKEHAAFVEQALDTLHGAALQEVDQAEALVAEIAQQIEQAKSFIESFGKEELRNAV